MTQGVTDNFKPKGFAARILGDQPTGLQKTLFWLMILSLTLWESWGQGIMGTGF